MNRRKPEHNGGQPPAPAMLNLSSLLSAKNLQEMLLERSRDAALALGVALLEQDVESLCGSRYERKAGAGLCHRGGSEDTSIIVGGARYGIKRPRVRNSAGEAEGSRSFG